MYLKDKSCPSLWLGFAQGKCILLFAQPQQGCCGVPRGDWFDQSTLVQATSLQSSVTSWHSLLRSVVQEPCKGDRGVGQRLIPRAPRRAWWALLAVGYYGWEALRAGVCLPHRKRGTEVCDVRSCSLTTCAWNVRAVLGRAGTSSLVSGMCVLGGESLEIKGVSSSFELWVGAC